MSKVSDFTGYEFHIKPFTADDLFPDDASAEGLHVEASVGLYNSDYRELIEKTFPGCTVIYTGHKNRAYPPEGPWDEELSHELQLIGEQLYGSYSWHVPEADAE